MSHEPEPARPFWRSRTLLYGVLIFVVAAFVIDKGGDAVGLSGAYKVIATSFITSAVFMLYAFCARNRHSGYAALAGLIALAAGLLFAAMYATNPDLFSALNA